MESRDTATVMRVNLRNIRALGNKIWNEGVVGWVRERILPTGLRLPLWLGMSPS